MDINADKRIKVWSNLVGRDLLPASTKLPP